MARRLSDRFADAVTRHSTDGVHYAPSFHTLSAHIAAGAVTAASLDGRLAGTPLAKNVGTTPGNTREGHTGLMRSAAAIDQGSFYGGQALDISLDPRPFRSRRGRRKFEDLLRTYFRLGGLQVQVNGVNADTLRRAMADPDAHRDLLVRKAGFSARFTSLPEAEQAELVERVSAGM
jgi:formate C-acetyltransferase